MNWVAMFLEVIDTSKILYFVALLTLTSGLFIMLTCDNYVRKIIGLSVMQSSVLIFYLLLGKVNGGIVPIDRVSNVIQTSNYNSSEDNKDLLKDAAKSTQANINLYKYSSPLPQVLMLTAIVVGFATLSLGLSLIYRISKQFGTISESAINFSEND
jgi:multicomponent Na+:H+ antiporter subunit C